MLKNIKWIKGAVLGAMLLVLSMLFISIPNISAASNFTSTLSPSKGSVRTGETFTVAIVMSGLDGDGLGSANYTVGFDDNLFTYVSTSGSGVNSNLVGNSVKLAFVDMTGGSSPKYNGTFATLTFTAKSTASTVSGAFSLSSAGTKSKNGDNITSTNSGTNVQIFTPSTNANLTSLGLSSGSISPAFNAGTTSYSATIDAASVTISATAVAGATITGHGAKTLNYGSNSFNIVVTAEDGTTKKTYTITINRPDNRSANNDLKELSVSNTNIKFDGSTSYTATVENNVASVNISATASDSKATVTGTGKNDLKVGNNTCRVTVTAENGNQKIYVITVIRKPKSGEELNLSKINTLKSLTIEGMSLDFDSEKLTYSISVENGVTEIKLHYELSDAKSSAVIEGKTSLDVGFNKISIIVTAENGSTRTYTLSIERKGTRTIVENEDKKIIAEINNKDGNSVIYVLVDSSSSSKTVSTEILKELSKSNKILIYEVVNSSNGVIYSVSIDGSKLEVFDEPFNFDITFESDYPSVLNDLVGSVNYLPINIKYSGKLPAGITIKIFIADKFTSTGSSLYLYYFNIETNKLELVQEDVKIVDGYIELQLDHASEYVLSAGPISEKTGSPLWIIVSIIAFCVVVAVLVVVIVIKKKNNHQT